MLYIYFLTLINLMDCFYQNLIYLDECLLLFSCDTCDTGEFACHMSIPVAVTHPGVPPEVWQSTTEQARPRLLHRYAWLWV